MKVYYINGSYDSCWYVRCMQPMIWNGWNGAWKSLRTSKVSNEQMFNEAMQADVIVFHRPIDRKQLEAAKLLKVYGKKIVMDNDDTYMPGSGVPTQMFGKLNEKLKQAVNRIDGLLKEFASISDLVTVSTEVLANEYKDVCKNVIVLPNCIDPMDWNKPKRSEDGKVRIGLVGSVASNQDYQQIKKLLDVLKDRDDVQIVLFALPEKRKGTEWAVDMYKPEFEFWGQYNPEWQHFCKVQDYMDALNNLELDIMLIPRHDNYFNRAKSNVKFLEASMCEIPVIAQGFSTGDSPYEVNPEDVKNLILCHNEDDWIRATIELIENKDKRIALGKQAKEYVLNNYNIKQNAHKWRDAYKTIYGK